MSLFIIDKSWKMDAFSQALHKSYNPNDHLISMHAIMNSTYITCYNG